MKILLIEPPFYIYQNIKSGSASLGLALLAAISRQQGHEVLIYQPDHELIHDPVREKTITRYDNVPAILEQVKERLRSIIESFQPDIVGISIWTARVIGGIELARYIRTGFPNVRIVAGGIHATLLPEEIMKSKVFDYVIRSEGEFAFVKLVDYIAGGEKGDIESIPSLSWVRGGLAVHNPVHLCENLDDIPYPAYDCLINYDQFDSSIYQSVMFSRGCPFSCTYCASHKLWTRKTRYHSPEYCIGLIRHLMDRYGARYFRFNDDTFTLRKEFALAICRSIIDNNFNIQWHCDTRVETVSADLLRVMKSAGLESIAMGVESGDEVMRKKIGRDPSLDKSREAFRIAHELGINTTGYFIIGFPGETYEQASRTLDLIEEIRPVNPCVSICIPYPGTECYTDAVAMGLIGDIDTIDWNMYYHHSKINFSGVISESDWSRLLERCGRIEEDSIRRVEEKSGHQLLEKETDSIQVSLRNVSIKRLLGKYIRRPHLFFLDAYDVIRWIARKASGRCK